LGVGDDIKISSFNVQAVLYSCRRYWFLWWTG